jgi:hypothetical protein
VGSEQALSIQRISELLDPRLDEVSGGWGGAYE